MKLTATRSMLISGVAVLGLALALPAAFAGGRGPGGGGPGGGFGGGRMMQALGLNDAQTTTLKTLREQHQQEMAPLHEQLEVKRGALKQLWQAPKTDRGKLIAATQDLATTRMALDLKRVDHLLAMKNVLTPEQFQKFVELRGPDGFGKRGHRGMRGHHGGGMRGGFGPGGDGPACDGTGPGACGGFDEDTDAE